MFRSGFPPAPADGEHELLVIASRRQPLSLCLECGFRADLIVEKRMVVEVKSVERLIPIHECQLLTYLRLARCGVGLLLNFNTSHLRHGIRRLVL